MPRGSGESLAALPATRQECLFARLYFVLPLAIAVLSIFWLTLGLVALLSPAVAAPILAGSALPAWVVNTRVVGGALVMLPSGRPLSGGLGVGAPRSAR